MFTRLQQYAGCTSSLLQHVDEAASGISRAKGMTGLLAKGTPNPFLQNSHPDKSFLSTA